MGAAFAAALVVRLQLTDSHSSRAFFGKLLPAISKHADRKRFPLLRRAKSTREASFVDFEEMSMAEPLGPFHARQLAPALDALFNGGMGLIPTDTQHAYVTSILSRQGTRRIYEVKGVAADERKPLSLLCADLSMASRFADFESLPRKWFQGLKQCLPGPYTFILRATHEVPRVVLEHKSRKRLWQRREVGIRVPACAVVQHITAQLEQPLLASSACVGPSVVWNEVRNSLDFIVAANNMASLWDEIDEKDRISTIIDLTMEEPVLRRQGMGDYKMFAGSD